jgi:hypothetical protein
MTTPAKVEVLIRVASQLISVLEQEVEYLREMKSSKVASLQAEKMKLVVAYEEHVRELAAAPDMLKKVAPALQDEFADIAERFDAAMTENRQALSAAHDAQERFMKAIVKAAEEKRASLHAYSPEGTLSASKSGKNTAGPLSLTLDSQI